MNKLVCGVGFNDKTKPTWVDGKNVKEYALWQHMLARCFSEKYQTRYPTYKGCNVSDNFLNYSFFYDWCQEQIGFGKVDEKGRSWCLDKDLLFVGNKTYSETTCVFVPNEINLFSLIVVTLEVNTLLVFVSQTTWQVQGTMHCKR